MEEKILVLERANKKIYHDSKTITKIFNHSLVSKVDVLREALNQSIVMETGLSVPSIRQVGCSESGDWAIISDYIEGETLQEKIDKDPTNTEKYLEQLVELQLKVNSLTVPSLPLLRDKMIHKINQSNLETSVRYELLQQLDSLPKHVKLCHGDFVPENIIFDKKGRVFILDWAHAVRGNASADVANSYLELILNNHRDLAESYLRIFCEKSHTAIQYVQKWMPIVAASLLSKTTGEKYTLLQSFVDVVDYE